MTRDEAAAHVGQRYGQYLTVVGRMAEDSTGNLKAPIDDALRGLGLTAVQLTDAESDDEEGFIAQVEFHVLRQVVRDLGPTNFDVTLRDNSFKLDQLWKHAQADLEAAEARVIELFGSTSGSQGSPIVSLDLNFLQEPCEEEELVS